MFRNDLFWSRLFHDLRARQLRQRQRRHVRRGELAAYMGPVEWSQLYAVTLALGPRRVVEWGAGGGTRALLRACPEIEQYVSVEHDRAWFERLERAIVDPRLHLQHVPPNLPEPENDPRDRAARERHEVWVGRCEREPAAMRDYVARPAASCDGVDLVFVDGRARTFCIVEGFRLLRPGGVLLVHDAQRPEYHAALRNVGHPVFLDPWELGQLALLRKPEGAAGAPG